MNMIEILKSIKTIWDEENLYPQDLDMHGYLFTPILDNQHSVFAHLKDRKSFENIGDILLMMLYDDNLFRFNVDKYSDDFKYAMDEMEKYRITAQELYTYVRFHLSESKDFKKYHLNKDPKESSRYAKRVKVLERYDTPFFISVTQELEIRKDK